MKKSVKIIGILLLLSLVCIPVFAFLGNPVSWALVWFRANHYLDAQYPELDIKIESIVYDYLFGGFDVDVISPTSRDTYFTLTCDGLGGVTYDRYAAVTSGGNTAARLSTDYRTLVQSALSAPGSPFAEALVYAGFCTPGSIEYYSVETEHGTEMRTIERDFSLDPSTLELDQNYDLAALGLAHGELDISMKAEEVSAEHAAELLLKLKTMLDEKGIYFHAIEFSLAPIPREGETITDDDIITLWDFLATDIYEEGLTDRIQAANEAYHDHLRDRNP